MTGSNLDSLLRPQSIAIIGASRDAQKRSRRVARYTRNAGFSGTLIGVNPSINEGYVAESLPFVRGLEALAEPVDLAYIALPAALTPAAVEACVAAGIRGAVLAASGFGETGDDGQALDQRMRDAVESSGMRLLGPNGFGLYLADSGVNLTTIEHIPSGDVALVSQSGNFAIALIQQARQAGFGFAACVGVGNQLDIGFPELLRYFAQDSLTRVIACYIEGIPEGQTQAFLDALGACANAKKRVVVMKAGTSVAGANVAATHTGALATNSHAWDALFLSGAAIRVHSSEEMADTLAMARYLDSRPERLFVLTNGGGDSVMSIDAIVDADLRLSRLSEASIIALDSISPPDAPRTASGNPTTLDGAGGVSDDPVVLARATEIAANDPNVDAVIISSVFGAYHHRRDEEMECVSELLRIHDSGVPILFHSAFAHADEKPLMRLRSGGIPVYSTVQRLVTALSRIPAHSRNEGGEKIAPSAAPAQAIQGTPLSTLEIVTELTGAGVDLPDIKVCTDLSALEGHLKGTEYPICIKLASGAVSHKSDVGGVYLNIGDAGEGRRTAQALWKKFPDAQLLVMPMLKQGFEILVGTTKDPVIGPLVTVGRGGIWTEIENDVAIRLAPLSFSEAREAILTLRCAPIICGRRSPELDLDALATVVSRLSVYAVENPDISLEMNPIMLYEDGYAVADLRAFREAVPADIATVQRGE